MKLSDISLRKQLIYVATLLLLTSCSSNSSTKYIEAGCGEVTRLRYDLAAQQFSLAAQNGDPEAVRVADTSKRIWLMMINPPNADTYEELQENTAEIGVLDKEVKSYCSSY